jgi:L-aspartate oxidase
VDALKSDIVVIGTGIAGLSFALRAAEFADVIMVTKKETTASSTNFAQGGIASVLAPTDSFEQHVKDTLTAGAGLCREDVVREIVRSGPQAVRDLIEWGVAFTHQAGQPAAPLDLGREGGHSQPRVVHAGDFTGREIEAALLARVKEHTRIQMFEHHIATRLLVSADPISGRARCFGADALAQDGSLARRFLARAVLMATGGAGQVYQHTTNPAIATGDGIALAYRAGARVANLEFMQFHPTRFYRPGVPPFLISETVRGEGAVLLNEAGEAFMPRYHPMADLAPRDIVARAIDNEMKKSGAPCVYLDITHRDRDWLRDRFPTIYERLRRDGIDMASDTIPVVPAAHYLCGGVVSDLDGRTDIDALYVSGEVACTGMHGANRLASNSLLEAVVLSRRAAQALQHDLPPEPSAYPEVPDVHVRRLHVPGVWVAHLRRDVVQTMWDYVGIVRTNKRLDWARRNLARLRSEADLLFADGASTYDLVELDNILTTAMLIVECAARRSESRGLHYNTDCPAAPEGSIGADTVLQIEEDHVAA